MITIYKIRNSDGLFSTGGNSPNFVKKGKVWSSRGAVTSHLSYLKDSYYTGAKIEQIYKNCEIIAYEINEIEIESLSVFDWKEAPSTTRAKELDLLYRKNYKLQEIEKHKKQLEEELARLNGI